MNKNYILKVTDAKPVDIQKALKEAGINVRSVQEVYKEDTVQTDAAQTASE